MPWDDIAKLSYIMFYTIGFMKSTVISKEILELCFASHYGCYHCYFTISWLLYVGLPLFWLPCYWVIMLSFCILPLPFFKPRVNIYMSMSIPIYL